MIYQTFIVTLVLLTSGFSFKLNSKVVNNGRSLSMQSYLEELSMFKGAEKKVMVGFTTDQWSIGKAVCVYIFIIFILLALSLITPESKIKEKKLFSYLCIKDFLNVIGNLFFSFCIDKM
jgi:hypothetical protein